MTIPVKIFGDYVACFESDDEDDVSMRRHFIKECGWTESQYRRIKDFAWFRVTVTIWKDAKQLAVAYLGCCCYETVEEFYTVYAGDYFSDLIMDCALDVNDPVLLALVNQWREQLRQPTLPATLPTTQASP